ncbi:hypothetical protein BpHYR1_040244 [Brachionus plicatilis]|uniref:Uncharacterized protein n=1 Tax=Brachionus plicatilis TaxID=10195 RepID=A0A3M7R520_BRAPC|nr:hypothetical protein BpHYR1_040244 [Brachionus plicatilis]
MDCIEFWKKNSAKYPILKEFCLVNGGAASSSSPKKDQKISQKSKNAKILKKSKNREVTKINLKMSDLAILSEDERADSSKSPRIKTPGKISLPFTSN